MSTYDRGVVDADDDPQAFVQFLCEQGLLGDATLASGQDPRVLLGDALRAGVLSQEQLAAARAAFRDRDYAAGTLATSPSKRPVGSTAGPAATPLVPPGPGAGTAEELVGQVVGGCRIDGLLGVGGMGAVYLATQLSLDRRVALKVQKDLGHPELLDRFRAEARTLGRMRSQHIVDIYEVGSDRGLPYFVMEFMPGGSLTGHVRRLPNRVLPNEQAIPMLRQSCLGLAEAWRHGVLHRDIKPDNLLLDEHQQVKIADFGIAKAMDANAGLTQTGFSPGTPAFKSPEQVAARDLDFRTDMYSLGVAFWTLLTGEQPRDVVTRQEQLAKLGTARLAVSSPELLRAKGDPLRTVVCRMMALDRDQRFPSWDELLAALDAVARGEGRPLPQPAPATFRWVLGLAAGLALAGGVWWATSRPGSEPAGSPTVTPSVSAQGTKGEVPAGPWPKPVGEEPPAGAGSPNRQAPPPEATGPTEPLPESKKPRPAADGAPSTTATPAGQTDASPAATTPPAATPDPNEAARHAFLAELQRASTSGLRSAVAVEQERGRLRSEAARLAVEQDPLVTTAGNQLDTELAAARIRDRVRGIDGLTRFEEAEELRRDAAAVEVPAYRDDCMQWIDHLVAVRPTHLRVAEADLSGLRAWATWQCAADNVTTIGDRVLPTVVEHTRRRATMALVWSDAVAPCYLDVGEVTLEQWQNQPRALPADQPEPRAPRQPVTNVEPQAVRDFLSMAGVRLPTPAEFAAALQTRPGDRFWWGNAEKPPREFGLVNLGDAALHADKPTAPYLRDHDDGAAGLAAADDTRFRQGRDRRFYHLLGNVAEWVQDGSRMQVLGGSHQTSAWRQLECGFRLPLLGDQRRVDVGFRAAHDVR